MADALEHAPAKVNLFLHVLAKRADGLHDLQSLVVFADAGDKVAVAGPADHWTLTVSGSFAEGLEEVESEDNLILRAARALASQAPCNAAPLALSLTKSLPVAAGIGGGSADAAAALRLLARRWGTSAGSPKDWASLGADIPVCLANEPNLVEGMGERLTAVTDLPPLPAVLVNPGAGASTGRVFAAFAGRFGEPAAEPCPPAGLDAKGVAAWLRAMRNDLTRAAIAVCPPIAETMAAIAASPGNLLARMSGSGSTCFGLYASQDEAQAAAAWLQSQHPHFWVKLTTLNPSPRG